MLSSPAATIINDNITNGLWSVPNLVEFNNLNQVKPLTISNLTDSKLYVKVRWNKIFTRMASYKKKLGPA